MPWQRQQVERQPPKESSDCTQCIYIYSIYMCVSNPGVYKEELVAAWNGVSLPILPLSLPIVLSQSVGASYRVDQIFLFAVASLEVGTVPNPLGTVDFLRSPAPSQRNLAFVGEADFTLVGLLSPRPAAPSHELQATAVQAPWQVVGLADRRNPRDRVWRIGLAHLPEVLANEVRAVATQGILLAEFIAWHTSGLLRNPFEKATSSDLFSGRSWEILMFLSLQGCMEWLVNWVQWMRWEHHGTSTELVCQSSASCDVV